MLPVYKSLSFLNSKKRIESILDESDNSFPEIRYIPNKENLTFNNGYYVDCTALFIDIRGSSNLPNIYKRPRLAKIYRVYLSEMVAVMNANDKCTQIRIVGDCVSGIFDTPSTIDIDNVFYTAASLISMVKIINFYFQKRNIKPIEVGLGMAYGRALMIKAGFSGSGINDIVWMGDVVNDASNLCGLAGRFSNQQLIVSRSVFENLNEHNKGLLKHDSRNFYYGSIVDPNLDNDFEILKDY